MTEVAAIVLAAGQASRFRAVAGSEGPATKLVALLDGKPLVRHVAEAALASRASPVLVVIGHAQENVRLVLDDLAVTFVPNPDFASGLATSLRRGVDALPPATAGVIVLLGDMPRVSASLIDRLVAAFEANPAADAVVPLLDGKRGNPALMSRSLFTRIGTLEGDVGARALLAAPDVTVIEVPMTDEAITFDVDTPDSLRP